MKKYFLAFLLLLTSVFPVLCQVNVDVHVNPPYAPHIEEWIDNPDKVVITLSSMPDSPEFQIRFIGRIERLDSSLLIQTRPGHIPPFPVILQPGIPHQLSAGEIADLYDANSFEYDGIRREDLQWLGAGLPEGLYRVCARAVDYNTGVPLSGEFPDGCSAPFQISYVEPPILVSPVNNDTQNEITPQSLIFQWLPPAGAPATTEYRMRIVEVTPPDRDPNDAMQTATTPMFFEETVMGLQYLYGAADPELEPGKRYAWSVQATDPTQSVVFQNDGLSEVSVFTWGELSDTEDAANPDFQIAAGSCTGPCRIEVENTTLSDKTYTDGDVLKIGQFDLHLTSVSGTGSAASLSGEGDIQVPYLRTRVAVEFEGLKVNTDDRVIEGKAEAKQAEDSPIDQRLANQFDGVFEQSQIENIDDFVSVPDRLVSGFNELRTIDLPIGFDNVKEGNRTVIGVVGMVFQPECSQLNAVVSFPLEAMGPNMRVGLGGRDICMRPDGVGLADGALLYLASDLGYKNPDSFSFLFKATAEQDTTSGCYVKWNEDGFDKMRLHAEAEFPRSWLKPVADTTDSAQTKAVFKTNIESGSNIIGTAEMEKSEIAGISGFTLEVKEMTVDFSDTRNPGGIQFPEKYQGITDDTWKGFYIQEATVTIHEKLKTFKDEPPSLNTEHLIIDRTGITAGIFAADVVQYPDGDIGKWAASIDTIRVDLINSSMTEGAMKGRIHVPVTDEDDPLEYTATLSNAPDNGLQFLFNITPKDTVEVPIWKATMNIDPTSHITVGELKDETNEDDEGAFGAEAVLNGSITIGGVLDNIPLVNLDGLKFEQFKVMTRSPHIEIGNWSFASPQKSIAGFPVKLKKISPETDFSDLLNPRIGLGFEIDVNLMAGVIEGGTKLTTWGRLQVPVDGPMRAGFDGADLEKINIEAEIAALNMEGDLEFYDSHSTYGNGFRGSLKANFLKKLEVEATAQFGSVNDFRYWYVDAMARFEEGIPAFPGTAFYGFGGGAWYNMERVGSLPQSYSQITEVKDEDAEPKENSPSGIEYRPNPDVDLGLRAAVTIGTASSSEILNADVALNVEIVNGGLGSIVLDGDFYLLKKIGERNEDDRLGRAEIQYVHKEDKLTGLFDVNFTYPPFDVETQLGLLFSPDEWYVKIGEPRGSLMDGEIDDLGLNIEFNLNAYFMAGNKLPGIPPPPEDLTIAYGQQEDYTDQRDPEVAEGRGIAFGASAEFDTGDVTFLIFYGRVKAMAGFDFSLLQQDMVCVNLDNKEAGWNGWRGHGQVWADLQGSVGVQVKIIRTRNIELLSLGAGIILQGEAPDPVWMEGRIRGNFTVLRYIDVNLNFKFEVGNRCIQADATDDLLAEIEIISDLTPRYGRDDVSVFAQPQARFFLPMDREIDFQIYDEETESVRIETFRFFVTGFRVREEDGPGVAVKNIDYTDDAEIATFEKRDAFKDYTTYEVIVTVGAEEKVGAQWQPAIDPDTGNPFTQTKTSVFTTGEGPCHIDENIAYSYPLSRQRFYLQGETNRGVIQMNEGYDKPFEAECEEPGFETEYLVHFIPLGEEETAETEIERVITGEQQVLMGEFSGNGAQRDRIQFNIPPLQNNTIYAVQLLQRATPTPEILRTPIAADEWSREAFMEELNVRKEEAETTPLHQMGRIQYPTDRTLAGGDSDTDWYIRQQTPELPGTQVGEGEYLIYLFHYRTSGHNTLREKLETMSFTSVLAERNGNNQSNTIAFDIPEGFDRFDLEGYRSPTGRIGPLLRVGARDTDTNWHRTFAQPWVYEDIERLREASPIPYTVRTLGFPSVALYNWHWYWRGRTVWERNTAKLASVVNADQAASPLQDHEIYAAGGTPATSGFTLITPRLFYHGINRFVYAADIPSPTPHFRHNHGLYVPADHATLKNRAGDLLYKHSANHIDISLPGALISRLQWVLGMHYTPMTAETYQLDFSYGYSPYSSTDLRMPHTTPFSAGFDSYYYKPFRFNPGEPRFEFRMMAPVQTMQQMQLQD